MSGPEMGQPYYPYPGSRVSIGDLEAPLGTEAREGLRYLDPSGEPSPKIIPTGGSVNLFLRLRTVETGSDYDPHLAGLTTEALVVNALTGDPAPGSPFAGSPPVSIATPDGDHGVDGTNDHIRWFEIEFGPITGLPDATYRVIIHGDSPSNLNFFYEDLFDVGGH